MSDREIIPPNSIEDKIFDRYFAGDASPEEEALVTTWLASDPANQKQLASLKDAWRLAGQFPQPNKASDVESSWRALATRTTQRANEERVAVRDRHSVPAWIGKSRNAVIGVAAAVTLVIGSALLWRVIESRKTPVTQVADLPMREIVARRGQHAVFELSDGTRVNLGPESRLRIPASFASTPRATRDIYLEGEGYFEVQHDSIRPFRVHTASGIAEDLGTRFMVNAYPESHGTQVVVAEGSVALHRVAKKGTTSFAHPLATLKPGDLARIDSAGIATLTNGVDIAQYLAWTHGELTFNHARIGEVLPQLARWYDLDIRIDTATKAQIADERFTASFVNEPVAEVLQRLGISLALKVEWSGDVVTISRPEGTPRSP